MDNEVKFYPCGCQLVLRDDGNVFVNDVCEKHRSAHIDRIQIINEALHMILDKEYPSAT